MEGEAGEDVSVLVDIRQGHCLDLLRAMPSESVQCCVTSPPYYGLRDYGIPATKWGDWVGCHGLEPTPELYIENEVMLFEEVRRVLKKDGTCWINLGDSYASKDYRSMGLKPKDLMGMPWRVALALQRAGWYLRQDIIWNKPNPMPESVTDRCTKAHEYIFLLTKNAHYYYDQAAIREAASESTHARLSQDVQSQIGSTRANGGTKTNGNMKAVARKQYLNNGVGFGHGSDKEERQRDRIKAPHGSIEERRSRQGAELKSCPDKTRNGIRPTGAYKSAPKIKDNDSFNSAMAIMPIDRNKRTVWSVTTFSFSEAHFATFPPDLIRPCIRAGSRIGDVILDPFGGSGTTGMVAIEEGRSAILLEINPSYIELQKQRTNVTPGML